MSSRDELNTAMFLVTFCACAAMELTGIGAHWVWVFPALLLLNIRT